MPWSEWICCLAVSIETEEENRRWEYLLAGGDIKKWKSWAKPKKGAASNFVQDLLKSRKVAHIKGNIETYAGLRKWDRIAQLEDGRFFNFNTGEYFTKPPEGFVFVGSNGKRNI
jgi:hypothetical protein